MYVMQCNAMLCVCTYYSPSNFVCMYVCMYECVLFFFQVKINGLVLEGHQCMYVWYVGR